MIGIIVPVHNEEVYLSRCLEALKKASIHPALNAEVVNIHIVLDDCSDDSERIIQHQFLPFSLKSCVISYTHIKACNVGKARAVGAMAMIKKGARWLAFTDGDTVVAWDWLAMQLSLNVDIVCGTVVVDDWSAHGEYAEVLRAHFSKTYKNADGHRHIHGANMGVATDAYLRAGGFAPLKCHEDVALVAALEKEGAKFAWSAAPRVVTSARTDARARSGFGDTLLGVVASHKEAAVT